MSRTLTGLDQYQKQFIDSFKRLTYSRSDWQVWADFVTVAACSIANSVDRSPKRAEREKTYFSVIERYKSDELVCFAKMLAEIVEALQADPDQDFLGNLFMALELGSHWHGQFFTPYSVCKMIAQLQIVDDKVQIDEKGYISVNDPACGAGALLIAFANACREPKVDINYQQQVMFIAQDIDHTAAMMCYIQLSLLGCPGMVIVGDTLRNPPLEPLPPEYEVWYTPFYFSDIWQWRRLIKRVAQITDITESGAIEPENVSKAPTVLLKPAKSYVSGWYYYYFYDEVSG